MSDLFWKKSEVSAEINTFLETISAFYPDRINAANGDRKLSFKLSPKSMLKVATKKDSVQIDAPNFSALARGLGSAFAGQDLKESTPFKTFGIMLDCSRNKVPTVDYLKKYLAQLSLMGYNMAMLYTEDTYCLEGEPFFGYMRGGFTLAEIQELDAFAKKLGIELVGCIQTLGHLEQVLRHWNYYPVRDTGSVLRVDEPAVYKLIEKMIRFWKKALSSKRIHIGMDETHDLGRGFFMDAKGYENPFELFNRHLGKVNQICKKNKLQPIIWSDMYFRLGNEHRDYYDLNTKIPADVQKNIPENVQLCYWDYYHTDADFYAKFIELHRKLHGEPILGSGVWTWSRVWYDHELTAKTVSPCLEASRKTKLQNIFFTMWGDNGAYCITDSSLAGLEFSSGLAYGEKADDTDFYSKRFAVICGNDYKLFLKVGSIGKHLHLKDCDYFVGPEDLLWDDPLMGGMETLHVTRHAQSISLYRKSLESLKKTFESEDISDSVPLQVMSALTDFLCLKLDFREKLLKAYSGRRKAALKAIANVDIPALLVALDEYDSLFRIDWLNTAKPFGLETIQRRNAGQRARLEETRLRILELLNGSIDCIEELDACIAARKSGQEAPPLHFGGSAIQ